LGISGTIYNAHITKSLKDLSHGDYKNLLPSSMGILSTMLLNLSIPSMPFPVPFTLIRSRFQVKPDPQ